MEYSLYKNYFDTLIKELNEINEKIISLSLKIDNTNKRDSQIPETTPSLFDDFFKPIMYVDDIEAAHKELSNLNIELFSLQKEMDKLIKDTKIEFTILDKIQYLAKDRKISLSAIEKGANLSNGTLRRWNTSYPSIEKLVRVADYLEVTLDYLVNRNIESESFLLDSILKENNTVTVLIRDAADVPFYEAVEVELNDASKKILLSLARSITYNDTEMLQQDLDFYDGKLDSSLNPIKKED